MEHSGESVEFYADTEPVPGVTRGWLYLHNGVAGPALVAEVAMLVSPDGSKHYETLSELRPVTITED